MADVKTPVRKLVDLEPKWIGYHGHSDRKGVAIAFKCPCLDPNCAWGGQIVVDFENPLDGGPRINWRGQTTGTYWQRTGDTFENLTLTPSIHCVGHWHGWLRNGELVSC